MPLGELFQRGSREPDPVPAMELEPQYAIAYEWGELCVTKAAQAAYNLTPLQENVRPGEQITLKKAAGEDAAHNPGLAVWLIGPDELSGPFAAVDTRAGGLGVSSAVVRMHADKDCSGLAVRFNQSNDVARQAVLEFIDAMGVDPEDVTMQQSAEDEEDVPSLLETLPSSITQDYAHALAETVARAAAVVYHDAGQQEIRRLALREMARNYAASLAVGSAASVSIELVANQPLATEFGILPAVICAATGGYAAYKDLQAYFSRSELREQDLQSSAQTSARRVGQDVHDTYCTAHFDRQLDKLFSGDDAEAEA